MGLQIDILVNNNYYITDSKTAEKFNNCRLDHSLRFTIDEEIIKDKMRLLDTNELNELWKMTSYEAKCGFIREYVDTIVIKEQKNSGNKIATVEIADL